MENKDSVQTGPERTASSSDLPLTKKRKKTGNHEKQKKWEAGNPEKVGLDHIGER